jgi:carboxylate-amine ligase
VDDNLKVLSISDQVIQKYAGKIVNFVELPKFTFGKELQKHVLEVKANSPFRSPCTFEETMQEAIATLLNFLEKNYRAHLLGTGMHPLLQLEQTRVWHHRHRRIYQEYDKIFNINQHGWLNIQSFHLNLPYQRETLGIQIHNLLAEFCAYLPAISASSPVYEGKIGENIDNRLQFYKMAQQNVSSVTGDVIPDESSTFNQYRNDVIGRFSTDLAKAGATKTLLLKEWVNSRGVIFRFDRSALEIRVMDEQECIKSDVALSCFIRAALRGLLATQAKTSPHKLLVNDFNEVIAKGLDAKVASPKGGTAREVCKKYLSLATEYAEEDEKKYLCIIEKRIKKGSLSMLIRERILNKAKKTDLTEAITSVYTTIAKCLANNQPYF